MNAVIDWQNSNGALWANQCDFFLKDFFSAITSKENCAGICPNCTHFTWQQSSGKCIMKNESVSQSNAFKTDDTLICGILIPSSIIFF
jgi:hypothetical protein